MALDSDLADLPDAFFAILQAYASLSHPKNLPDLLHCSFTDVHDFLLNWLLLHPHFRAYQPSGRYQVLFWKWAIQRLETLIQGQDAEIDDRIYTHLVDMVQGLSSRVIGTMPPEESYVTYLWRSPDVRSASICAGIASATLLESRMLTERGTTGLTTWIASISLAEFLIKHPDVIQQQRVLELGSGAGFLGIVVATLHQQQYNQSADSTGDRSALWLTDAHPLVLERCRNNIRLPCNASSSYPNVHCTEVDWTHAIDKATCPLLEARLHEIDADVIIGADIIFDPDVIPALVDTLSLAIECGKASSGKDVIAYIAPTVRNEKTLSQFVNAAGHSLELLDVSVELDGQGVLGVQRSGDQVKLYKLQHRR